MARWKKALAVTIGVAGTLIVVGVPALVGLRPFIGPKMRPLTSRHFEATPERLARGRYLATSGRVPCVFCHSPLDTTGGGLQPFPGREFSGRNWVQDGVPFLVAPNLTSDTETGIGTWTDDQLARAIREGIGHDGRTLFPVMPYQRFRQMSDEDLASVIVFLRSLPPVHNPLPPSHVPFPLNKLINSAPEPVGTVPEPDMSTPEKRGAYIVAISACADCHTTRDDQGNMPKGMDFAGGTALTLAGRKTVYSANLTPSPNGIPYYTEELFIETMRTGKVRGRMLDSMMPTHYFRNMTDQDLKAIFAYLKTLEPVDHYVDNSLPPTKCARCGLVHGGGERNKAS